MALWKKQRAISYLFINLKQVKKISEKTQKSVQSFLGFSVIKRAKNGFQSSHRIALTTQSIIDIWNFNLWEGEDNN